MIFSTGEWVSALTRKWDVSWNTFSWTASPVLDLRCTLYDALDHKANTPLVRACTYTQSLAELARREILSRRMNLPRPSSTRLIDTVKVHVPHVVAPVILRDVRLKSASYLVSSCTLVAPPPYSAKVRQGPV
jgi:hypothetical protein